MRRAGKELLQIGMYMLSLTQLSVSGTKIHKDPTLIAGISIEFYRYL